MSKDRVDFTTWTNEDFKKEYELIQKKESKLPFSQRKQVIDLMAVEQTQEVK